MALANRSEHDAAEVRRERTGRPGAAVRAQVSFVEGEETRKGTDWVATEEPLEDRLPLRDHLVLV